MTTAGALARRVAELTGRDAGDARPVGGGDICDAYRVPLSGGRRAGEAATGAPPRWEAVFAKTRASAPPDFFAAEADGLNRLRRTGTVAVPEVLAAEPDVLLLQWIEPGSPSAAQAERLGRELAALHDTPAPHYGTTGPLYLGPVPLPAPDPPVTDPAGWSTFHVEHRLLPLLRLAVDRGHLAPADSRAVEEACARLPELAGPPQPPAVVHGDLWSGNILWSTDRPWLIDPCAQGGHPETDLAFLELFGAPHLDRLLAAYAEARPLPGRAARVPLHQLQHLLVHAALFGGGYGVRSGAAARAALSGG